jgi:uncharacterized protein (TIGR02145 family)
LIAFSSERYINLENTAMKSFLKIIIIVFLSASLIAIMQFCNKLSTPTVTTATVSEITQTSAVSGGNVTNNGGDDVTARGICWSTTSNPTITSSKTSNGTGNGSFTSNLTQLTSNTLYHIKAYATNSVGTAYGDELTFTTTAVISAVPDAPIIGTVTGGNAQASVAFTAPASDGGSSITGYTATSSPGGFTGTGTVSPVTVTGLTNGTVYTFAVTATNANGTSPASSASISVTPSTVPGAPTIGTAIAGNTQATITFTAPASNGGSAITGYTVTSNPGGFTATGNASPITVTGLTNGTPYTFTVTATNASGIGPASSASNSVTPFVPVTDGDGNVYNTVTIGTQVWMKENLKTTKYNNGVTIPPVTDNTSWVNLITPGYCWYNNDASTYKNTYGALYNWYTVNTGILCPIGWHVPTVTEWTTLGAFLGGDDVAGGKMKEVDLTHWLSPNTGATNESGFTGLPGGLRGNNMFSYPNTFGEIGRRAFFWTSTEVPCGTGCDPAVPYRGLGYNFIFIDVSISADIMNLGFSVRCVKN